MRRWAAAIGALALTWAPAPAQARVEPEAVEQTEASEEPEPEADEGMEPGDEAGDGAEAGEGVEPGDEAEGSEPEHAAEEPPSAVPPATAEPTPSATHDVPADDFEAEPGTAPGGYYGHGVILERPPPDGRNRIIVGSILVPLGTIATVTSAVGTWLTVPEHCGRRLRSVGIEADAARCQGLFTFNAIRTTYGALMLASGATILVLGLLQRERYRKWRYEHGMRARLEPAPGLRLRF